jgi:tetratricopeptide (TPR) repeat protein
VGRGIGAVLLVALFSRVAAAQSTPTQKLLATADEAYDRSDFPDAAARYDRVIATKPFGVPPATYAKRASIFLIERKYEEGVRWIRRVAEKTYPDDPLILEQKAVLLAKIPVRMAEALELAEREIKRRPEAYTLHLLIAGHYDLLGLGWAERTITAYEAYLKTRPVELSAKDKLVRIKLGLKYLDTKDFRAGQTEFETALQLGQDGRLDLHAKKGLCAAFCGSDQFAKVLTTCKPLTKDTAVVTRDPWIHYELGRAYLALRRRPDALGAVNAYLRLAANTSGGYVLRGQVFLAEGSLAQAEQDFLQAERLAPNRIDAAVPARWLGVLYLEETPPQAAKAISKLTAAVSARPDDVEALRYLALAYLADRQPRKAAAAAESALLLPGQARNIEALRLAGDAYALDGDLPVALSHYLKVLDVDQGDAAIGKVVATLNRMAQGKLASHDLPGAEQDLLAALRYQPGSLQTHFNLGIIYVELQRYDRAVAHLAKTTGPRRQGANAPGLPVAHRLLARAYLGMGEARQASEHFAKAEADALAAGAADNDTLLAEIDTEWAPLLLKEGRADESIARLERAVERSADKPFHATARRNLARTLLLRGLARLHARQATASLGDLERAGQDASLLGGEEQFLQTLALGLAYLSTNQPTRARATLQPLPSGPVAWLRPPFDKLGVDLFYAYALYREGAPTSVPRAIEILRRLLPGTEGPLRSTVEDLLCATLELVARDQYERGESRLAQASLKDARRYAKSEAKALLEHNLAVLDVTTRPDAARSALLRLAERVPEALVNLGILYDSNGDAENAYEIWKQAKARGVKVPELDDWLEAKRRFFSLPN